MLRKLTDREFCSELHRRLYQQEQETRIVVRLADSQRCLPSPPKPSVRPNGILAAPAFNRGHVLRPPVATDEEIRGFVFQAPAIQVFDGRRTVPTFPELSVYDPCLPCFEHWFPAAPQLAVWFELDLPPVPCHASQKERGFGFARILKPLLPRLALSLASDLPDRGEPVLVKLADRVVWAWALEPIDVDLAPFLRRQVEPLPGPGPRVELPQSQLGQPAIRSVGRIQASGNWPVVALAQGLGQAPQVIDFPCAIHGLEPLRRCLMIRAEWQVSDLEANSAAGAQRFGPATLGRQAAGLQPKINSTCARIVPQLLALTPPSSAPSASLAMRKPRIREVFFPLPRLGSLPAMAARLWRAAQPSSRRAGGALLPLCWIVKSDHRPQPLAGSPFAWRAFAAEHAFQAGHPSCLPGWTPEAKLRRGLSLAGSLPVFAPASGLRPARQQALSMDTATIWDSAAVPAPRIACSIPPSLLVHPVSLPAPSAALPLEARAASNSGSFHRLEAVPCEADQAKPRRMPQGQLAQAALELPHPSALATMNGSCEFLIKNPRRNEEPLPFLTSPDSIPLVCPGSRLNLDFQPSVSRTVMRLEQPVLPQLSLPDPSPCYRELRSVWPEPARQLPRMRTSVIEDSALVDAARRSPKSKDSAPHGRNRIGLLPWLRTAPFSQLPDWKWATFVVPVLLLVALVSVYSPDSLEGPAGQNSSNPQQVAQATEGVSEQDDSPSRKFRSRSQARLQSKAQPSASQGLATHRESAPAPVAEVLAAPVEPSSPKKLNFFTASLNQLRQTLSRRAAISLSDDFRSGLADWEGKDDWSQHWSYDPAGFVLTGPLALFRPSLNLTDYEMNLLAQIEKKSIGWVFRAQDTENYYAMKITLTRGGPLPEVSLERYAVIGGKTSSYARHALPIQVRLDTVYPIQLKVKGSDFTLRVQGQVVDYWSDNRLKWGGVGLFSHKGEQARVRWIEVSHQYDALGRLCAFLAPYKLATDEGSTK
ncbi:MAG: hypothetical protein NZV14_07300 [Bryobacteraceae bacterium]|nr:hypothetical protein [Bryobacteraceae bacterium]MDW8377950.1 hypothetical protein [Bryobacterales bacterium]